MSELRDQLQRTLGDNYSLERELGGGGMSRVFLAEETSLGRKVVVKVLPPDLAAAVNLERFRREIQLAAKLQHPHIVPVLAAGVSDGLPYYTMPFIEGESLRAKIAHGGPLPVNEVVRILRDTLSALSYAHEHGIVHRDIKPDNILLTDQHAVVADFGVAKALSAATNPGSSLTSLGVALGTPAYMAPEQAAADPTTDHRADIYAVGAVGYEMLTGQQVFSSRSPQAMLAAHAMEAPEPLQKRRASVPAPLASLIMRALEKYAADRPQTAREMLAELDAAVTPSGATTPHMGGLPPIKKVASSSRSTIMAIAATALLLLLGSASWYWRWHRPSSAAAGAAADTTTAINSVAVIPFVNTGGGAQDEYFSDGMTDELAHALSRVPHLRVAGRSSSYAFKGKNAPAQEIGKTLNVAAVVEGSIRRAGERLRVIAQLTSAADGRVVWSDSYESKAKDVFQVQDEFTKAIVGALTPALSGNSGLTVASASRGTTDADAYDLYLKGRYFFLKRGEENLTRSVDYFSQALKRDPQFARAHAGLSMTYAVLPVYAEQIENPDSVFRLSYLSAKRAVSIDSTLGDAHLALAEALSQQDRYADAETEFKRALALQPADMTTHQWHGENLTILGELGGALAEERRAKDLDPLSALMNFEVGEVSGIEGKYDSAITYARRALELQPGFSPAEDNLIVFYILAGKADSALIMLDEQRKRGAENLAGYLTAYAALGRWDEANKLRTRIEASRDEKARLAARMIFRDISGAVDIFVNWTATRLAGTNFGCDPQYDLLKRDPRFVSRLARVGAKVCPAAGDFPIKPPPAQYAVKK